MGKLRSLFLFSFLCRKIRSWNWGPGQEHRCNLKFELCSIRLIPIGPCSNLTFLSFAPFCLREIRWILFITREWRLHNFLLSWRLRVGAPPLSLLEKETQASSEEKPRWRDGKERPKETFSKKLIWENEKDVNSSYHCNFLRVRKIKIEFDGDSSESRRRREKQNKNNNLAFLPTWRISFFRVVPRLLLSVGCMTLQKTCEQLVTQDRAAQVGEQSLLFVNATMTTTRALAGYLGEKSFKERWKMSFHSGCVSASGNTTKKSRKTLKQIQKQDQTGS